jgi:hypothetical protein
LLLFAVGVDSVVFAVVAADVVVNNPIFVVSVDLFVCCGYYFLFSY